MPTILGRFYADYEGSPVPADEHFLNVLEDRYSIPRNRRKEAAELILENARFAGILHEEPNGDRSISIQGKSGLAIPPVVHSGASEEMLPENQVTDYSKICFLITPIGDEDSDERKHADLIMKHLVKPILEKQGLEVVRADKIGKPGLITQQVIEHLALARLCIADLSFHNPNAFYEIGVRHAFKLPTIQVIRKGEKIPFDVSQGRTIIIDTADAYTIIDNFTSAREELKEHVTHSLASGKSDSRDNPISYYIPNLKVEIKT